MYVRVIYIIHDVYIIYEQHAPGNVVLHGEIVKIPLEIFIFFKKNAIIFLLYNNKNTSHPFGRCSKINFKKQHTSIS